LIKGLPKLFKKNKDNKDISFLLELLDEISKKYIEEKDKNKNLTDEFDKEQKKFQKRVDVILENSKERIEKVEEKELNILQKELNLDNLEKIVKKDFSEILKKYGIQNIDELDVKLDNSKKLLNVFDILYDN
jgi:hypothetical protein